MSEDYASALPTKVAGRMATLFFVCAGLPLAALAVLTIVRTSGELSSGAEQRLRYEARTLEQQALNRLDRLAEGLESLTRALELDDAASLGRGITLANHLPTMPKAAVVRLSDGKTLRLFGDLPVPQLSAGSQKQLAERGRVLASNGHLPVIVVKGMRPRAVAAAMVDDRWVFGLDEKDHLPFESAACVATGFRPPQCSIAIAPHVIAAVMATVNESSATIPSSSGPQVAWVSSIGLMGPYNTAPWKFALMRPRDIIHQPIQSFVQDLLLVVSLTALIVAWLSVRQVKKQLGPLAALTAATAKIRRHEFDDTVEVSSDDEFAVLGDAFNEMATELRGRFADLEAFNIGTLTALARAIDAKSPWTAGHSERVTGIAVRIAEALDLPQNEVDELRKGGLVHDIGKIATPVEILDKATRLTASEERVMQLHPEQGVHILEPIPAFKPVLPIVGQHHERWDGSGYPSGLAGTAIARTARVLAVADVYDALRSRRPYRSGLPHERVVKLIRQGAGRHFDPDVVAALLRIEGELRQPTTSDATGVVRESA